MDEWVMPGPRIISLPSVAGAKYKTMQQAKKKEQELEKKRQEQEEEERIKREIARDEDNATRKTRVRRQSGASPRPDGEPAGPAGAGAGAINVVAVAEIDEHEGMDDAALKEHEEVTKVKNVSTVSLGRFSMDTWYVRAPHQCNLAGRRGGSGGLPPTTRDSARFRRRRAATRH
jgi:histone acetyltransferase MYST1